MERDGEKAVAGAPHPRRKVGLVLSFEVGRKEQRRGHPEGAVAPRHLLRSGDNARREIAAGVTACREKHACGGEKQKS